MIDQLIKDLSLHKNVEAITLGGSRATGHIDEYSDYDLYVYLKASISESERIAITKPYCDYMEYSNNYWELEDDGILKSGVDVELIYRNIDELESSLNHVVLEHQASFGYTTCFWHNLMSSKIVYDANDKLTILKEIFSVSYPEQLKINIIDKNHALLKDKMSSYYYQIEKAIKRQDHISINHRLSELLACYYDILFAVNETLHPGEKKLHDLTKVLQILPKNYEKDVETLFLSIHHHHRQFLDTLNNMLKEMNDMLILQGYQVTFESYLKG